MTSAEIRRSFLEFFAGKSHTIVPSASLLPDSPNLLFTNAGMNQFVPIFLGERPADVDTWPGAIPSSPRRAADTQKCIRAGGKHNDLDDVGLDTYHHTFFEMLGNWSFGDYFKKEAIEWAWELVIEKWKLPPQRLYATVYKPAPGDPSEFDQEAHSHWSRLFESAGLDPAIHIVDGNKKDNFWMMGDTGPCGPCSELHIDLTPNADTRGALVNAGDPACIEIWNLVFIQFNANPDGTFSPLPARHVDTGMGFERVTSLIQCTKNFTDFSRPISNYETDIFRPLFDELEKLSGKQYRSTLPAAGVSTQTDQEKIDIAFRVIADHIRTLAFAIADGIDPGNTDRHYVLRRILRRAVRYGRTLGFQEPFFYKLAAVLARTMGDVFPEVRLKQKHVEAVLKSEEEAFNRTLDKGIQLFREEAAALKNASALPGDFAFKLYDTYGFPLDLTQLMAREHGLTVDAAAFDSLMEAQRARARAAQKREIISLSQVETTAPTRFLGYDSLSTPAKLLEVVVIKEKTALILDASVCYAEMGGQVGDTGEIIDGGRLLRIVDTRKSGNTWLHFIDPASSGEPPAPGADLELHVDAARRAAIQRHHTVTHLLHWALREVVSRDAVQKGSFVGPEKLTFDFNSPPLTADQVRDVEELVNAKIVENATVIWTELPYAEVKGRPDIMQFFGEKYGGTVRVVQIGGASGALDGYSMELCAGTHARATGEIGLFRILSEAAISSGVRRIEAVAGLPAYWKSRHDSDSLQSLAANLKTPLADISRKIESLLAQQKEAEKNLKAARQRDAAARAKELAATAETLGTIPAIVARLPDAAADDLQSLADALKSEFKGVVILIGESDGQVGLVAAVSPDFVSRIQAGKLIQTIAPIVGGKGGGRPDTARGAGKDPTQISEALAKAKSLIKSA